MMWKLRAIDAVVILTTLGLFMAGCGGSDPAAKPEASDAPKYKPADEEPGEETAEESPEEENADPSSSVREGESGLYRAPSGPPEVQIAFIEKMMSTPLVGNSIQSQKVDYEDRMGAVLTSCDLILLHKKATDEQKRDAISTKFYVLAKLSADLESADYAQQAMDYAAALQSAEPGTIEKEMGVTFGVQLLPQQFSLLDEPTESDVKKLVEGYLSYLDEGPLPPMFLPGLEIVRQLNSHGYRTDAINVLEEMIAAISEEDEFPDREVSLKDLAGQLRVLKTSFPDKLRAAKADDAAFDALESALDELLADEGGESKWLQFLHEVGLALEQSGRVESAAKVYARLAKNNENAVDPQVGELVKQLLSTAETRKNVLGQSLDFTAHRADGSEFSISSLQGKPVLLLFWTTSDPRGFIGAEMQNIQQVMMEYSKPFEVVLVNVDDDPQAFREFSELQRFEWATASVRCADADLPKLTGELEKKVGIDQAPLGVLIDKEGKVQHLFAQGERLYQIAEEADSPAEETTEEEPAKPDENEEKPEKAKELPQDEQPPDA